MTTSGRFINDWQDRLNQYERQLAQASARQPWLARAYVRVLMFLLRQYGRATPLDNAADEPARPRMQFQALSEIGAGKPARTTEQIRGVLSAIQQTPLPVGPLASHKLANILVVTYRHQGIAKRAARVLRRRGIDAQVSRNYGVFGVYVPVDDAQQVRDHLGALDIQHGWQQLRPRWVSTCYLHAVLFALVIMLLASALQEWQRSLGKQTPASLPIALGIVAGVGVALSCYRWNRRTPPPTR